MLWGERFLDGLALARHQIDAKLVSKRDQVAPGMTVTFDVLGNQLLDASRRHGHRPLLFTLLELYLLVERTLERRLEIQVQSMAVCVWRPSDCRSGPGLNWYSFGGRPGPTLYSCQLLPASQRRIGAVA